MKQGIKNILQHNPAQGANFKGYIFYFFEKWMLISSEVLIN